MESLRRAVAAGLSHAAHLRVDTDLDPIRSRPDFQLLQLRMMDAEFPIEPFARPAEGRGLVKTGLTRRNESRRSFSASSVASRSVVRVQQSRVALSWTGRYAQPV